MVSDYIDIIIGLFLMGLFGHRWSSAALREAVFKDNSHTLYSSIVVFLLSLALCIGSSPESVFSHKKESVKEPPTYILFLDSRVIRDKNLDINDEALNILNTFLEKTDTKIVITSRGRIDPVTQTNWPIETLRTIYKTWGIRGTIIGATPYIKQDSIRQQEINLWYNTTKMKYDGCVILDESDSSVNNLKCTVKVKNLLTNQHIINVLDKLKMDPDPDMFKEKVQTYGEQFKTRFG